MLFCGFSLKRNKIGVRPFNSIRGVWVLFRQLELSFVIIRRFWDRQVYHWDRGWTILPSIQPAIFSSQQERGREYSCRYVITARSSLARLTIEEYSLSSQQRQLQLGNNLRMASPYGESSSGAVCLCFQENTTGVVYPDIEREVI